MVIKFGVFALFLELRRKYMLGSIAVFEVAAFEEAVGKQRDDATDAAQTVPTTLVNLDR
jgi:hypothetical protein